MCRSTDPRARAWFETTTELPSTHQPNTLPLTPKVPEGTGEESGRPSVSLHQLPTRATGSHTPTHTNSVVVADWVEVYGQIYTGVGGGPIDVESGGLGVKLCPSPLTERLSKDTRVVKTRRRVHWTVGWTHQLSRPPCGSGGRRPAGVQGPRNEGSRDTTLLPIHVDTAAFGHTQGPLPVHPPSTNPFGSLSTLAPSWFTARMTRLWS